MKRKGNETSHENGMEQKTSIQYLYIHTCATHLKLSTKRVQILTLSNNFEDVR